MQSTGSRVKFFLQRCGLEQSDTAELLGLAASSISLKLSGRRPFSLPEIRTLLEIFQRPEHAEKIGRRLEFADLIGADSGLPERRRDSTGAKEPAP